MPQIDDDVTIRLAEALAELLQSERQAVVDSGYRKQVELRHRIAQRETLLQNSGQLDRRFEEYLDTLPDERKPRGPVAFSRAVQERLSSIENELNRWKGELSELENPSVDKQSIFDSARAKVRRLLVREARKAGLWPDNGPPPPHTSWQPLATLLGKNISHSKPSAVKFPDGHREDCKHWNRFYIEVVEWLLTKGHFADGNIDRRLEKCLYHPHDGQRPPGNRSAELPNGMWLNQHLSAGNIVEKASLFVRVCGEDARQFFVRLG